MSFLQKLRDRIKLLIPVSFDTRFHLRCKSKIVVVVTAAFVGSVYAGVHGHWIVVAWATAAMLAWAFLWGAGEVSNQSSRERLGAIADIRRARDSSMGNSHR